MLNLFHPLTQQWFRAEFGEPTEPQRLGWPSIASGKNTLIAAPTGSGKTLAAFLCCIDQLIKDWEADQLQQEIRVVYVSPLKALSNDIHRNLLVPLDQIRALAGELGSDSPPITAAVRTGDTPSSERQKMLRRPPHILVTTPESLYLLLTSEKGRERLRRVTTVIVDEIHALARDKRGSHLALSLERLVQLCDQPPVRIGLSATQRPIDQIARFLVGNAQVDRNGNPDCEIVDVGHARQLDLALEVPQSALSAVCSHEQWDESYQRLVDLIKSHRSTLIFVNTRRLAERVSHHLTELLGEEKVASHHGSLSRQIRLSAEQRLKAGELHAIVATASLEMGIDIGFIDLVCQIGSPRSISTFLQRIGRSGHSLGLIPKGRLFPLTRDELIECLSLVRAVNEGILDAIEIPKMPLDILAQQIVASVAAEEWEEDELYELVCRAWPYRDLSRPQFDRIIEMLSNGIAPTSRAGAYLHRDAISRRLRPRRGARIAALTSGGAIPETAEFRVVNDADESVVGSVDEDFAVETMAGDVFLLGNTSWRVRYVRQGQVVVQDAEGAPPSIPFWFGEAPGRTVELSDEISRLRRDLCSSPPPEPNALASGVSLKAHIPMKPAASAVGSNQVTDELKQSLIRDCGASRWAAEQAIEYIRIQKDSLGIVPTGEQIVFERFFDESGGMQLVVHAPLGARINRAWGLAMRKRFCRSFDFELQAAATDNGFLLSIGPQHSFPIDSLFNMISPENARDLLEQALLASPIFQTRWRWNVTRALGVLRMNNGKKVPPHLQRFRSDDLLSAVFPQSTGCLENHHGDVQIPDHPLVSQTVHDTLHEAMDLDRWLAIIEKIRSGNLKLVPCDTCQPSPFCDEILNANPYAFLDDAPLEERRSRAIAIRRSPFGHDNPDLGQLDPNAIAQVAQEAWPLVRNEDELHDALMSLVAIIESEIEPWSRWLDELSASGRVARIQRPDQSTFWIATENWPLIRALFPNATAEPMIHLPARLERDWDKSEALLRLLAGRSQHSGPFTAANLAQMFGFDSSPVRAVLEALEGQGRVLRGLFSIDSGSRHDNEVQWCDRRLLARIHRLTVSQLRRQIKPVDVEDYMQFLVRHHHLHSADRTGGAAALRQVIHRLQGFEAPAGAWESQLLAARVPDYQPEWLDQLFMSGELVWGRLRGIRRDDDDGPSMSPLTRTARFALMNRDDMAWLLPPQRTSDAGQLRSGAALVLEALTEHGALFFPQLHSLTGLLPTQVESALRELARLGLVTSDNYAAVRSIVKEKRANRLRRTARRRRKSTTVESPTGRWSLFPGIVTPPSQEVFLANWCHQLIRRFGIVFRDLLARETAAPPWYQLVRVFRLMELRGEIRGGRFVDNVGGEQFASEDAVTLVREIRELPGESDWIVISAADPINLVGIVTPGKKIAASHKNSLILTGGRCIASCQAGEVQFYDAVETDCRYEMTKALRWAGGRRL